MDRLKCQPTSIYVERQKIVCRLSFFISQIRANKVHLLSKVSQKAVE
nr:MAG TPA: hypothetical protein [Caudoviricetes sp.]